MIIATAIVFAFTFVVSLLVWRKFTAPDADKVARAKLVAETVAFVSAKSGELAKVEGFVEKGPDGVVKGPISGGEGVWLKVEMTEDRGGESFASVTSVTESHPFDVGGVRVVVETGMEERSLGSVSSGPVVDASPAIKELFAKHGKDLVSNDGFTRRRDFIERRLIPGTEVFVLGKRSPRRARAEPTGGYRGGALVVDDELHSELVFFGNELDIAKAARRDPFGTGDLLIFGITFLVIGSVVGPIVLGITAAILD